MPRPLMKRAIPERSFLPPREPGRIAHEPSLAATHPGIAESLLDRHRTRQNAGVRAAPPSRTDSGSRRPTRKKPLRWLQALRAWLDRRAERRLMKRATERLGHAQDHLLRDIGISQMEIAHRVRFTRRNEA